MKNRTGNKMSQGTLVVYQGEEIGFDDLLTEGVALLESDQQEEGGVDLALAEAESEMLDFGFDPESPDEEDVDSDLVKVGSQILNPGNW